jgi:hypothetical protein
MCRKMTHLVAFVLVLTLLNSICRGLENFNILREEVVVIPNIAHNPEPSDGTIHKDIWVKLSWSPGLHAVSHDVYIGKNYDDVYNGTNDTFWTFWGNQDDLFRVIGFDVFDGRDIGLMVPGATIYWRVDEVNDLHPDSPWKGNVWSFTTVQVFNWPISTELSVNQHICGRQ